MSIVEKSSINNEEDVDFSGFLTMLNTDPKRSETTIKTVCSLLESGDEFRRKIWLRREEIYDCLLLTVDRCIKTLSTTSVDTNEQSTAGVAANTVKAAPTIVNRRYGLLHLAIRAIIRIEQYLFGEWKAKRRRWQDLDVQRIINTLLAVIKDRDCPADIVFLTGTAFCFHLHSLDMKSLEAAQRFMKCCVTDDIDCIVEGVDIISITTPIQALPLLHGLFACGKYEVLLAVCGSSKPVPFIILLFKSIAKFCETACGGREYQTFQTLVAWLRCINRNPIIVAEHFKADSHMIDIVMNLLDFGWSSTVVGVSDLSWNAFGILLDIHRDEKLILDLLRVALKLSWTAKGKYPRLAALIKHFGAAKLLLERPRFLYELSESLSSNRLSSASRVVYRAFLVKFRSEMENLPTDDIILKWTSVFSEPLMAVLQFSSSVMRQNAIRHWIPVTLQFFPFSFNHLIKLVTDGQGQSSNLELLSVQLSLLRVARVEGIADCSDLERPCVNQALGHANDEIRIELFTLVCSSRKKCEPLSGIEMSTIRKFLPVNLNIDSASFRRKLLNNFKILLIRIRDFCIKQYTELTKNKISLFDESGISKLADFLDWLLGVCQSGFRPGGCYQRRMTCLGLYQCILDVFVSTPTGNSRKGVVPSKCDKLLKLFSDRGKFLVLSDMFERRLLFCVMDPMVDVQATATRILDQHFNGLLVTTATFANGSEGVINWALQLCASPKTMNTQSGANLLALMYGNQVENGSCNYIIRLILTKLEDQLTMAKLCLWKAANSSPMHGLLLALRYTLCSERSKNAMNDAVELHDFQLILKECFSITEAVVQLVLGVFSSKSHRDTVVPSFSEISIAIDVIVDDCSSSSTTKTVTSCEHQLVLSCCWLSLKESSLLLSNLVHFFLTDNQFIEEHYGLLTLEEVRHAARLLLSILTKCRHRGAIESCNVGFELLCKRLLDTGQPSAMSIVTDILNEALTELEIGLNALSTSITRRSAGLPLLIATIVRSDHRPSMPLLMEVIQRIVIVAKKTLPDMSTEDDGLVDVPQAHAFHVLRALVHDAALSQDILCKVATIMSTCLDGFYSSSWAVRNAALQLFGALVPLIVGQKKTNDKDNDTTSIYRQVCTMTMTFSEFFNRWIEISKTVEQHLLKCINSNGFTSPTVVPILSLLCNLENDNISANFSDNVFCEKKIEGLCNSVRPLLCSREWHVRQLAALFIARSCPPHLHTDFIFTICKSLFGALTSNERHGLLVVLKHLVVMIETELPLSEIAALRLSINEVIELAINEWAFCPILGVAALELYSAGPSWIRISEFPSPINVLLTFFKLTSINSDHWKPGYSLLTRMLHQMVFSQLHTSHLVGHPFIKQTMGVEELEALVLALKFGKRTKEVISLQDRRMIGDNLFGFLELCFATSCAPLLLKCLEMTVDAYIQLGIVTSPSDNVLQFVKSLIDDEIRGKFPSAIALALWATIIDSFPILEDNAHFTDVDLFVSHLRRMCEPRLSEHFRIWAAKSLNISARYIFCKLKTCDQQLQANVNAMKLKVFDCCMLLLQDEHPDVRKEATKSVGLLDQSSPMISVHPNLAMQMIGSFIVGNFNGNEDLLVHLWKKVGGFDEQDVTLSNLRTAFGANRSSLFEQEDVNVYAETCYISRFYGEMFQMALSKFRSEVASALSWMNIDQVEKRALLVIKFLSAEQGAINVELHCRPQIAKYVANVFVQLNIVLFVISLFKDNQLCISECDVLKIRNELKRQI